MSSLEIIFGHQDFFEADPRIIDEEAVEYGSDEIYASMAASVCPKTGRVDLTDELAFRGVDAAKWRLRALDHEESDIAASVQYALDLLRDKARIVSNLDLREQL